MKTKAFCLLGHILVGVGAIGLIPGVVIPTVFLWLLALPCYKIGSPDRYERLRNNERYGCILRDWDDYRVIAPKTKRVAIIAITASFTGIITWWYVAGYPAWSLILFGLLGLSIITYVGTRASRCPLNAQSRPPIHGS